MASIETVLQEKLCSGCGACSFADPGTFTMGLSPEGWMLAEMRPQAIEAADTRRMCPFSGESQDEAQIAASLWPDLPADPRIGRHAATLACHVAEERLRMSGSSGGLTSWICLELLRRGEVDGIVHVQPVAGTADTLFRFAISRTAEEVRRGSKSRYYAVTMAEVLREIAAGGERFAVVAVPCFARALRLLVQEGKLDGARVPYVIGLVCGHMKSRQFADYLAWQKGAAPGSLTAFDFRHKLLDRRVSDYGFRMNTAAGEEVHPMASVRGKDWGEGSFKVLACEFCDDVLAECADLAVGDARLPRYTDDPKGMNVAVLRNARIVEIIEEGRIGGSLVVEPASVAEIVQSQSSGLRHRREGLAHRLARRAAAGKWSPAKRVEPALAPGRRRRQIYDLRLEITLRSAELFPRAVKAGDIEVYERDMAPLVRKLWHATQGSPLQRTLRGYAREARLALVRLRLRLRHPQRTQAS